MSQKERSQDLRAFDILVVGGGATGLGVALQAALEGRRVALVEARDFASGTSSRSTKLLHGGVRYLAQGHIHLVREALRERAHVLQLAPHLAQPLSFVVAERSWPMWVVTALGLKLYEWLAGRFSLGRTQWLGARGLTNLLAAMPSQAAGVRYWDGQFEDARLALTLARTAARAGAEVHNHTAVTALSASPEGWMADLRDAHTGQTWQLSARCVVNATGVWVDGLRQLALAKQAKDRSALRPLVHPSQGVHLVVDRATLPLQEAVLVPRTADGRVLFAVPWLGSTVIGTTDTPRDDAPLEPRPMAQELAFLFEQTRASLGVQLRPDQVKSVWVGLRPLVQPPEGRGSGPTSRLSREHLIVREAPGFWTVTGGKWTTYRSMAEQVMAAVVKSGDSPDAPCPADTRTHLLDGVQEGGGGVRSLKDAPGPHLLGSHAQELQALPGHDVTLGLGLTEAMVRYAARHEWAVTVEDMLARRWRMLFLDARLAEQVAPRVAQVLEEETGKDAALAAFLALCRQYRLPEGSTNE